MENILVGYIEPKIKDLVIGLRRWGIETVGSCQGHHNWGDQFPWVSIAAKDLGKAKMIVDWYNRLVQETEEKKIYWLMSDLPAALRPEIENKDVKLEELQKSAINFGKKLQGSDKIIETL